MFGGRLVSENCACLHAVAVCVGITLQQLRFLLPLVHMTVCTACREEIQRLKALNPSMTHKEAFGLAADQVCRLDPFVL